MSSPAHEDPDPDTVPSILTGHEEQRFVTRHETPTPPDYLKTNDPGTRKEPVLIVHYKSPDWTTKLKRKMEGKWIEVPFADVARLVLGRNPTKTQVKNLVQHFLKDDFTKIEEKKMYPILCTAFNAVCSTARSKSVFKDVADSPESTIIDMRPDLVMYPKEKNIRSLYLYGETERPNVSEERRTHIARCMWGRIQAFVECKERHADSAFHHTDSTKFLRRTDNGEQCQAQIAKYASEIQIRQHRTHVWSFYFAGPHVRIKRWDRAGCMVSTSLNFQEEPAELVNFLFRFVRLDPEQLGYDPMAVLATPNEIKMLADYKSNNVWLRDHQECILEVQEEFPILKVSIPTYIDDISAEEDEFKSKRKTRSADSKAASVLTSSPSTRPVKLKTYLLGEPVDYHNSPVGRATKGFVALDMETRELVFVKDQWRAIAPGAHPELETYDRLWKHSVGCVATCLGGSDVFSTDGKIQRTLTHELLPTGLAVDNSQRYHTRLITKEIGRPLAQYPNSTELITMVFHALMGHNEAWEHAGVLHRDISAGNIMIAIDSAADELTGFLNDWDMCKYKEDLKTNVPALPGRSGTWATLSTLSLQYPKKPHEVADDLESAVYVLVQMALRFHQHSMTVRINPDHLTYDELRNSNSKNEPLANFVSSFFDTQHECEEGYWSGGAEKRVWLEGTSLPVELDAGLDDKETPLELLLDDLYHLLRRHYAAINYADIERFKVPLKAANQPAAEAEKNNEGPLRRTRRTGPANPAKTKDALSRVKTRRAQARDNNPPPPQNLRPQAGPSTAPRQPPKKKHITVQVKDGAKRVLDGHEEILKAFERALYEDEFKSKQRDLSLYKDDKWFDQFDGLSATFTASDKRPSGGPRGSAALKRKAYDEAYERMQRMEVRKLKKVRGETWRGGHHILGTVQEEEEIIKPQGGEVVEPEDGEVVEPQSAEDAEPEVEASD